MSDVHTAIETVWKRESTGLIAAIARVTRDIDTAEELAQDALVSALERWPDDGIPANPAAWLMTVAKRSAIDILRRGQVLAQKHEAIAREHEVEQQRLGDAMDRAMDEVIDDDVLRLIFTACHPVVPPEGRVALTLRLIGGLTTAEIARAFLVPEKTIGQRIYRAKKTLSEAHVPFETPRGEELSRRVKSVLSVVYLIFNEGYTATSGEEWMRAAPCDEALRLGRMLAQLLPGQSEVHALLALMELTASRTAARRGSNGEAVLLPDQDRSRWDQARIERGMASLEQAQRLHGGTEYYALQAAIAACHMRARTADETDWDRIVLLYNALMQVAPSPIVALNRAVAVGMAHGPAAGLAAVDAIASHAADSALIGHHLLHSVRGDLLMKLGDLAEAHEETRRAIALTQNLREQELLTARLRRIDERWHSPEPRSATATATESEPRSLLRAIHLVETLRRRERRRPDDPHAGNGQPGESSRGGPGGMIAPIRASDRLEWSSPLHARSGRGPGRCPAIGARPNRRANSSRHC